MHITKTHPEIDLIRYIDGELDQGARVALEEHLASCEPCRTDIDFIRSFSLSLKELHPADIAPEDACPDSWTLASYEAGDVDEETARRLRAHLMFCTLCRDDFYALRRPRPKVFNYALRAAGALIERIRAPLAEMEWALPAPVVSRSFGRSVFLAPFQTTETLKDPHSGEGYDITLRVEGNTRPDAEPQFSVVVAYDEPVPEDWTVRLIGHTKKPFDSTPLSVESELPCGFYDLEVSKGDECLGHFSFTIELFNLTEALNTAFDHLNAREYGRALAVIQSTLEHHPESTDLSDLQMLAVAMALRDTERESNQQSELHVRAFTDAIHATWDGLKNAGTRFSSRLSWAVATAAVEPLPSMPPDLESRIATQDVSLALLRTMELLAKRLETAEGRIAELIPIIGDLTSRLDGFTRTLSGAQNSLNVIRRDVAREVEDKMAAMEPHLIRIEQAIQDQHISLAAYEAVFSQKLGGFCWTWLEPEVRQIVVVAEAVYRYLGSERAVQIPDFSPTLLQFCRGFELLLNKKLQTLCREIVTTISQRRELSDIVAARLPSIRLDQVARARGSFSPTQVSNLLIMGKVLREARSGSFSVALESLLGASPGITDTDFVVPLMFVTLYLRNGTAHGLHFTSPEKIQLLRKLLFGLDEYAVDPRDFLYHMRGARWWWFTEAERNQALVKFEHVWEGFPGLVWLLWSAIGNNRV